MSVARRVVQYTTDGERVAVFASVREAQEAYGITHISSVCRRRRRTDGGDVWVFEDEDRETVNGKDR